MPESKVKSIAVKKVDTSKKKIIRVDTSKTRSGLHTFADSTKTKKKKQ